VGVSVADRAPGEYLEEMPIGNGQASRPYRVMAEGLPCRRKYPYHTSDKTNVKSVTDFELHACVDFNHGWPVWIREICILLLQQALKGEIPMFP
jgi:hypothetical protein